MAVTSLIVPFLSADDITFRKTQEESESGKLTRVTVLIEKTRIQFMSLFNKEQQVRILKYTCSDDSLF